MSKKATKSSVKKNSSKSKEELTVWENIYLSAVIIFAIVGFGWSVTAILDITHDAIDSALEKKIKSTVRNNWHCLQPDVYCFRVNVR